MSILVQTPDALYMPQKLSTPKLGMPPEKVLKFACLIEGPFVRLAPNHISITLPDAQPLIYGYGNGALTSLFYDVFVTTSRNHLTQPFAEERCRVLDVCRYIGQLLGQWEKLYAQALKGVSGEVEVKAGKVLMEDFGWTAFHVRANYVTFDIINDLAFGRPFGMTAAGKDSAPMAQDQHAVMNSYGQVGVKHASREIQVIKMIGGLSQTFLATLGTLPRWWRSRIKLNPLMWEGGQDFRDIIGLAIMAVSKRLEAPTDRNDILSKLQAGKDEDGNPMGREELTAEALTVLIAGSDTTANSTCALIYYLARTPSVQEKLQKELDEHLDSQVATAEQVKNLPYLQAVINEGNHFPEGTTLSAPIYTIHRDSAVFGDDVEEFRPERWFKCDSADVSKVFAPFSVGPRACIGRNLANLEPQIIIGSNFKHFHIVLENPDEKLKVHEGVLRKPVECRVGLKRREVL
ncbi:cytochrome P450 monooxygenase [Desarmillaria tabescens]|uniref:Cytochrome P450 monooxygenase n=1 Tax=Armillaria tabescens TaxID=1929756 RepID=A0AA39J428_ARMTA|nr:cytochrome P450 monooxygenase [Desarmillaria tabescens]KAK0435224.1 cytochrome P450 monooxygenase [Desarmillaria tabescens]